MKLFAPLVVIYADFQSITLAVFVVSSFYPHYSFYFTTILFCELCSSYLLINN